METCVRGIGVLLGRNWTDLKFLTSEPRRLNTKSEQIIRYAETEIYNTIIGSSIWTWVGLSGLR